MLDLKQARAELNKKSYREIQEETAWKWGSRAAVSYEKVLEVSSEFKVATFVMAEEYYHEAIEHAALVEEGAAELIEDLQDQVRKYQDEAFAHLEKKFHQEIVDET
jgi:hypothetical protein